jgi:tetratricopeptide (TPR) repeat protein
MTKTCKSCGRDFPAHQPFCPHCGSPQPIAKAEGPIISGQLSPAPEQGEGDLETAAPEKPEQIQEPGRSRWSLWRATGGCLGVFMCILLVFLAIGGVAAYQGLQERAALNRQEAVTHYERGLAHMQAKEYELAIAEFEHTLRLDPSHREAREALRDAKTIALTQPTPTSATLNEAIIAIFEEAQALAQEQRWEEVVQRLTQVHDLAPDFRAQEVSDMLYTANFNLGLELLRNDQTEQGIHALEEALAERPGDLEASRQLDMASLYASAQASWNADWPSTIDYLEQLYTLKPDYLDVRKTLYRAYEDYGDDLVAGQAWCVAELQYHEATMLEPGPEIQSKQAEAARLCRTSATSPTTVPRATATRAISGGSAATLTATGISTPTTSNASGSVIFSRFNEKNAHWEIVSVDPGGGVQDVILGDATQPAASPDGRLLAYHSEVDQSEGLHVLYIASGEDIRVTTFREDATPDWAPDSLRFVFPSQRSGDRRWQVYIAWADGKGDPVALVQGRTPAWSPNGTLIAYQGTDAQGNNPGLYLMDSQGGASARITQDESDRAPAWSPGCASLDLSLTNQDVETASSQTSSGTNCRLAFMSTQAGNWEIYIADLPAGKVTRLTNSAGNDGLPTWSPDGRQLAFVSDRDGAWGIYVMPAAGGKATRIADWGEEHSDWLVERIAWTR